MPFSRPTLTVLARQSNADIAEATGSFVLLRSSPLGILAKAVTGLVHGVYGYIDWLARQVVPWTAEGEFLEAWAALVGIQRKAAAAASGSASFTGTPGAVLPEGTLLARGSDGVAYLTMALATVGGAGTVTVPLVARDPGAIGNAVAGATVLIASAVSGVNAAGTLAGTVTGGADDELDDDFRVRMLERFSSPPQGGAERDYIAWAKEVPGVTRAWVTPNGAGAGTVVVYVMLDEAEAAHGGFPQGSDGGATDETRIFPATGDQLTVANHIFPLRPATALLHVVAPIAYPVDVTVADLSVDTTAIRSAVIASLTGLFRRRGRPGGTIYQSDIAAAIDATPGVDRFTLLIPAASVTAPTGRLPVLGTVTWS